MTVSQCHNRVINLKAEIPAKCRHAGDQLKPRITGAGCRGGRRRPGDGHTGCDGREEAKDEGRGKEDCENGLSNRSLSGRGADVLNGGRWEARSRVLELTLVESRSHHPTSTPIEAPVIPATCCGACGWAPQKGTGVTTQYGVSASIGRRGLVRQGRRVGSGAPIK